MASPASSDEGEIVESSAGDLKAHPLPQINGFGVDRMDRNRARNSRSKSPELENGSRHRPSPGPSRRSRSPRGYKRSRDDRDGHRRGRSDADPRQFRVHYEDSMNSYRRSRLPYDDEDQPSSRSSTAALHYDDRDRNPGRNRPRDRSREHDRERDRDRDRDRYPEKRLRNRTRSPHLPVRNRRDRDKNPPRRQADRDGSERYKPAYQSGPRYPQESRPSTRPGTAAEATGIHKDDTKVAKGDSNGNAHGASGQATESMQDQEPEKVVDIDAELERRRRRREELLSKTRAATPMLVQALQGSEKVSAPSPAHTRGSTPMAPEGETPRSGKWLSSCRILWSISNGFVAFSSPRSPATGLQEGMSPAAIDISNDQELINMHGKSRDTDDDGPSAADYDPTADMREDELRDELRHGHVGPHGEVIPPEQKAEIPSVHEVQEASGNAVAASAQEESHPGTEGPPRANDDDDDFDMFAEEFDEDKFAVPKETHLDSSTDGRKVPTTLAQANGGGILEGADKDGYYKIRIGEILNGRYQVQSTLGKGMFSGVARAMDLTSKKLIAIKMMRNNDALRKGGFTEIAILQKLNDADPENRKHIVKFERHFEHKGHLCLAFENLSLNLREVLRKFGNNIGINLRATRTYAHQIFVALAHLRKCSIVHADLKPDNILVSENRSILKLCDLGTAIDKSDAATAHNEITPYLVSRFYRAPEIIMGIPYDYAVDMWSIGCTLYELYTGKILFTGDSNNQMLKAIMEIRGKFSTKLYKRGELSHIHWDDRGNFISVERDKALGKTTIRPLAKVEPTRDLRTRLLVASVGMNDVESRELYHFVDLLERCLTLNPDKRITPSEALKHPFFTARADGSLN
ncbi:kinase-like protein [Xylariaceae sp. FL0804]|nr:kinase-like protein [Xylariaceae sp. FL0804]